MRSMRGLVLSLTAAAALAGAGCSGPETRSDSDSPEGAAAPQIDKTDVAEAIFTGTRYYQATGLPAVYEVLPGKPALAPQAQALGLAPQRFSDTEAALYSDEVQKIEGEVSIEAIDRLGEDQALEHLSSDTSGDKAIVKGWFRGLDGKRYEFSLDRALPAQPGAPERSHFGGVGTDVTLDGDSAVGTPLSPKVRAGVAIWGVGTLKREGEVLGQFPFETRVASRTRSPETGRYLPGFDATQKSVDQIDLIIKTGEGVIAGTPPGLGASQPPIGESDRTVLAGVPKSTEPNIDVTKIPGFHVVWSHANIKFRPF